MKAMAIRSYGGPEVVEQLDLPTPTAGPEQVLIKVEAAAVNPIDWKIRKGEAKLFVRVKFPIVLGGEIAGEVTAIGAGVTRFKVGDKVFALLGDHGGLAELAVVAEANVALRPAGLDSIQAASIPVGAITALQSLRDKGELKSGQKLLVNGASGAVGLYAVQLGKLMGAKVTAVCSEAKFDLVKGAGADECLDYKKTDFTKLGKHWDLIFDAAATRHFSDCHQALEPHGIYVTTINSGGDMVAPALNPLRGQKARFIIAKPGAADLEYIKSLVESGKLKPLVGKTFTFAQTADAQAFAESGKGSGKTVITLI